MRKASQHRSDQLHNKYAVESIEITTGQLAYGFVRTLAVNKVEPPSTEGVLSLEVLRLVSRGRGDGDVRTDTEAPPAAS